MREVGWKERSPKETTVPTACLRGVSDPHNKYEVLREEILRPNAVMALFKAPEISRRSVVTIAASAVGLACLATNETPPRLRPRTSDVAALTASVMEEMED